MCSENHHGSDEVHMYFKNELNPWTHTHLIRTFCNHTPATVCNLHCCISTTSPPSYLYCRSKSFALKLQETKLTDAGFLCQRRAVCSASTVLKDRTSDRVLRKDKPATTRSMHVPTSIQMLHVQYCVFSNLNSVWVFHVLFFCSCLPISVNGYVGRFILAHIEQKQNTDFCLKGAPVCVREVWSGTALPKNEPEIEYPAVRVDDWLSYLLFVKSGTIRGLPLVSAQIVKCCFPKYSSICGAHSGSCDVFYGGLHAFQRHWSGFIVLSNCLLICLLYVITVQEWILHTKTQRLMVCILNRGDY